MSIPIPEGGCKACAQVHQPGQIVCLPYEVAAYVSALVLTASPSVEESHRYLLGVMEILAQTYHKIGIVEQAKHEGLTPTLNTYIGVELPGSLTENTGFRKVCVTSPN